MRVRELMTEVVESISPAMPAEDAWNLMRENDIHHLIVTEGKRIRGVLSDRDLGGPRGSVVRKGRVAADLMTAPVVTVTPDRLVNEAANLMRGRSIGCLVVEDLGRPVGIITVGDLLELVASGADGGATGEPAKPHVPARPMRNGANR